MSNSSHSVRQSLSSLAPQTSSLHGPLPIIQSCPHAGLGVPPEVQQSLAISEVDLSNDADLWADIHYDFSHPDLSDLIPPGHEPGTLEMVTMPIARALIDVNRHPDDLANPDGPVKTRTSYGRPIYKDPISYRQQVDLLEHYWWSYHLRLNTAQQTYAGRTKLFLDCHSMAQRGPAAYAYPGAIRPLIGLSNMGDANGEPREPGGHTSCSGELIREAARIAAELFDDLCLLEPAPGVIAPRVAINWPFLGGYIIREYSRPGYLAAPPFSPNGGAYPPPGMLIEVNRGLFIGDQTADTPVQPPNMERIADVRRRLYQWVVRVVALL